jgi:Na+/melibiose symporter-like transporter
VAPSQSSGALWRHRDFLRLWAAQSVSSFGSRITREGLPYAAVLTIDAPPAQLGLLAALAYGPSLLVGMTSGGYIDRSRKRRILVGADLVRAAILLTVPVAAWFHLLAMTQIYVVAACAGVASALFDIADHAYLPRLIARDELMEGNTKLGVTESIAEIGGPPLAGLLVQWLTAPIAIAVNAFTYLVSALFLASIRTHEAEPEEKQRRPWHQSLAVGFSVIMAQPLIRPLFYLAAIQPFFGAFFSALYAYYAIRVLHLPTLLIGITVGIGGLGSLAGAAMAAPMVRLFGVGRAILIGFLLSALSAYFVPLAHGGPLTAVIFLALAQIFGDSFAVAAIVTNTSLRQSVIPLGVMGRVGAVFQVAGGAPGIIGALAGGLIGGAFGARTALFVAATGIVLAILPALFSPLWRLQEMPVAPDPASG